MENHTAGAIVNEIIANYGLQPNSFSNITIAKDEFNKVRKATNVSLEEAESQGFNVRVDNKYFNLRQIEIIRSRARGGTSYQYMLSVV